MNATIRKIYAYRAVEDFILIYPLYNVMFADRGLSTLQISTLLILWSAVSITAEVPSGVLADKYSRKNLLAVAQIIRAVGYAFWIFMPTYLGFAIGFVLWGLGGALTSGTFEALVYDELKAAGEEKTYVKVMGRAESLALVANVVATAAAAGGILLGYNFLIVVSIVAVLISTLVAFSLPNATRIGETGDAKYFAMLRAGVRQAVKTPAVFKVILLGAFIGAIYGSLEEYVPLFVQETGAGKSLISIIVAVTVVAAAVASFQAYRLEKLRNTSLIILLGLSGGFLVMAGMQTGISSWVLVILYTLVIHTVYTLFGAKLQHAIEDGRLRATTTSVYAFIEEVMAIVAFLLYGLLADASNNAVAFKSFGLAIVAVSLVYLIAAPRFRGKLALT